MNSKNTVVAVGCVLYWYCLAGVTFAAEHHLLLCGNPPEKVMQAFNVKPSTAKTQVSYYFDDRSYSFYKVGVITRLRLTKSSKARVDVKLRPLDLNKLPPKWRHHPDVSCEQDVYLDRLTGSCRMRREMSAKEAAKILKSGRYSELVSSEQRAFVADVRKKRLPWQTLAPYGPAKALKWESLRFPLTLEILSLKNGTNISELSLRKSSNSFESGLVEVARNRNLKICQQQKSKTWWVLNSRLSL